MMDVKSIVALVLTGVGVLFDIIGLAIPYWRYNSQTVSSLTDKIYIGLWEMCDSLNGCRSIIDQSVGSSLEATRAFVILGMLLGVGAIACFLVRMFVMKDTMILNKVAAGVAIAAGIFMLIGAIIYATDDGPEDAYKAAGFNLHAGFALVIIASVFAIAGGVFMFISPN